MSVIGLYDFRNQENRKSVFQGFAAHVPEAIKGVRAVSALRGGSILVTFIYTSATYVVYQIIKFSLSSIGC